MVFRCHSNGTKCLLKQHKNKKKKTYYAYNMHRSTAPNVTYVHNAPVINAVRLTPPPGFERCPIRSRAVLMHVVYLLHSRWLEPWLRLNIIYRYIYFWV